MLGFAPTSMATVAPFALHCASGFNLQTFHDDLNAIETSLDGELVDSALWRQVQDLYWRAHESDIVRPFLGSYYLPRFQETPDYEAIQHILGELRSRTTPGPINRTDSIAQNAFTWNRKIAVRQGREGLTYGRLDAHGDILGRFIAGTRESEDQQVAVFFSRNRIENFAINLGAKRAGVPYTNFHSYLSREQFMEKMQAHSYRALFVDHESLLKLELYLPLLEAMGVIVVDIDNTYPHVLHYKNIIRQFKRPPASLPDHAVPEYPGPMMMSSGTTGEPKLVRVPKAARAGAEANTLFKITGEDRNLVIGQLYHGGARSWAVGHLNRGGQVFLTEESSLALYPEATMDMIDDYSITNFWVSPPWLKSLCLFMSNTKQSFRLDSLRAIYVGAAPFHPSLKQVAVDIFGPIVWENYATTEFGLITVLSPDELLGHATTVGRAAPGVELEIRDQLGHPVPNGTPGTIYVKNALTGGLFMAADDIGSIDDEGYLTVLGRSIEKITTKGLAVFPRTIENEMRQIFGVRDCHVIGIPDDALGERVVAAVVLAPGGRLIEEDIIDYMNSRVDPALKGLAPNAVVFLRTLPRAPYKVHNRTLIEVLERALERQERGLEPA